MIEDSLWIDIDLPMELEFKLERVQRLVDELTTEEMRTLCKASIMHNFHLMHYAKQSVARVAELEDERPKRKTRKAPSKSRAVPNKKKSSEDNS